ncbi:MAG TPA: amidohydrolase family protein [Xanthobacteraceae bacterium]|jgi:predicted TIM-barrel fold metal-dependent hydrolase|nr:amidohydrolase family protein [Xanthobacteraceae bacterium]
MSMGDMSRRAVLAMLGASAAGAAISPARAQQAPWSSGTGPAKTKAPPNATDCHHHIYSSRFKVDPNSTLRPGDASVADYRLLQKRIGTSRNVIVQPSTYGVYNDGLIEALNECGPTARGVAVVNTSVTDDELKRLQAAGVRGVRFNLATPGGATTMAMLEPVAKRIAPMGWHVQFNMSADMTLAAKDVLSRLPCEIVFDHLAHIPQPAGPNHPAFAAVVDLMQKGKAWVKLSGAYQDTKVGPPTYADTIPLAQAYVKAAPERLVWGSDWPHPSEQSKPALPDDAVLFDLLAQWAPDEAVRNRILVDNPAKLYGFS